MPRGFQVGDRIHLERDCITYVYLCKTVYKQKLVNKNHISMSLLYFSDSCMLNYAAYVMYVARQILTNLKFMRKKNAKEIKQKCKEICGNWQGKKIYQVNLENHEKNCSILKLHPTRHWKNASPTYSNVFNVQHKHNSRITMGQLKAIKLQGLISVFFKTFQIIKKGTGKKTKCKYLCVCKYIQYYLNRPWI